jgi:hypothetical protein
MPPRPLPPKKKPAKPNPNRAKDGSTTKSKVNPKSGLTTTVRSNAAGKPVHVTQWETATGKRVTDKKLPMG